MNEDRPHERSWTWFDLRRLAVGLAAVLTVSPAPGGLAAQSTSQGWSVSVEPLRVDPRGHDQHVLTVGRQDVADPVRSSAAVALDTRSGTAYRGALAYRRGHWSIGATFFWFTTSQATGDPTSAAPDASEVVVFEVADRQFTSSGPAEILFHRILEDTDVATWTLDVYGSRTVGETPTARVEVRGGLRLADFDNDYRALAGVEGVEGVRFDASSNYGRMAGPLVAATADWRRGDLSVSAGLGQAVVLGQAELTRILRDFDGPSTGQLTFTTADRFEATQDIAVPISDARLSVVYRLLDNLALLASVQTSVWWDVAVPPGVLAAVGGDGPLLENTIVFTGVGGGIQVHF
ncbi:MAG TPA: hypothetical protein VK837_09235 [Longimicrobiales bacterium]|nr:hypothetical protein [Longimicrobiales bacterium]